MTSPPRPLRARLPLLGLLFGLLAACSGDPPSPAPAGAVGAPAFPRIVPAFGELVPIPAPAQRALPGTAAALDFLVDLVGAGRLAAVPFTARDYTNVELSAADWERLPTFRNFQGEELLPLRPDFVLTHGYQRAEATRILAQAGIPVVRLPDLRDFEGLLGVLEVLGRALGEEPRAAELRTDLERRRAALAADGSLLEVRALTYLDFGTGGWTAGTGTSGDLLLGLAGLRNAAAEAGLVGNVELDHERLMRIDPDLFVLRAPVQGEEQAGPTLALLRSNPNLARLAAVREERIVILPARHFAAESHRLLDAAELLHAQARRVLGHE